MSNPLTESTDARASVQFGTIWKSMAVLSFLMLSSMCGGVFLWGLWVTGSISTHSNQISVLFERTSGGKGITQSVNVGSAAADTEMVDSAKTWLTTRDVAEREGCDERTVLNYIARGQIVPMPEKDGKSWRIAENFRIIPPPSETGGKVAVKEPECEEAKP
jgi:hypothetical protein